MKIGIIFDLDGTLWDTSKATAYAVKDVSKLENIVPVSDQEIINSFGENKENIAKIYFPNIEFDKALDLVDDVNIKNIDILQKEGGRLYPRLREVIKNLSHNYNLFIVSNAIRNEYIEAFLVTSSLKEYFTGYMAAGAEGLSKSSAIKKVIKDYGLEKSIYVGDTKLDYDAATDANIPFIHAKYGFQSSLPSKHYINNLEELESTIKIVLEWLK